ncbi:acyl--CoA ligase [Octadecabacter sp. CECT 8868]|uniref:class I adenylate-forming enzyme family protein n=1 Tax=Octadecabacter algicola TaxID=2909342 RepID=UPI001F39B45F|nr:class I adenylate-forming enzyme family protein [Octadecabacter algicola]MCF2906695.1 acyl--CoA ligase [Octadecabacter algicola]
MGHLDPMEKQWPWHRFVDIATGQEDLVAIFHGDTHLTFAQLQDMAGCQAAALDQLGRGDRAVIISENNPQVAIVVAAIWQRGGIPVLVHSMAPDAHAAHAITLTDPKYVFAPSKEPFHNWPAPKAAPAEACSEMPSNSTASIVFTSGSTGLPKGVMQSAENLIAGARTMSQIMAYHSDDRILCPVPFAFDYGWGQMLSLLLEGIPLVLTEPANSLGICAALDQHQPTVLAAVPALLADLMSGLSPIADANRDTIRLIMSTGSKMLPATLQKARETFPAAEICLNYGLTETYRSASLAPKYLDSHPTSVGKAIPEAELRIIRRDDTLADVGEVGEIVHFGSGCFQGYWRDLDRTNDVKRYVSAMDQVGVFTGDLGHMDQDGFLYLEGRKDRQIKSMGVRVSPDELEGLLASHSSIAEAAIVSKPHEVLGEMIVAFVVPQETDTDSRALLKELKAYARGCMSNFMQPRIYHVVGSLPRNPSKKIDYVNLRQRLETTDNG